MGSDTEDAFRWDGDDDASARPRSPGSAAPLAEGWHAVGKGSESVERTVADDGTVAASDPQALSTPALLAVGIIAGVYLLYVVGWILGGLTLQGVARFFVSDAAYVPAMWLAVAAPVLWFAAAWLLTRGAATWMRIAALAGGIVVLIPWPFVFFGALGGGS